MRQARASRHRRRKQRLRGGRKPTKAPAAGDANDDMSACKQRVGEGRAKHCAVLRSSFPCCPNSRWRAQWCAFSGIASGWHQVIAGWPVGTLLAGEGEALGPQKAFVHSV